MEVEIELGEFDTGLYSGYEFNQSEGRAWLTIHVDEVGNKTIEFEGVRYHQFTELYACSFEMVDAYFKLVNLGQTQQLVNYLKIIESRCDSARDVTHFRIFLDESGCFDIYASSASSA
ncbi:hypothetical protein QSV34_03920 [Porticoccus sp. W117]|uniref:hypothetical protein n=1 Tax=Porticoccus sp. W117 TaxID=3054777 RepID=UPI0025997B22|nr:hypothetical protein [Porticoccus sp. W117]MDM3870500.1 hypothetical protein [Porticoccus sp. W117]